MASCVYTVFLCICCKSVYFYMVLQYKVSVSRDCMFTFASHGLNAQPKKRHCACMPFLNRIVFGLERALFGDRFQPFLNRIFFGLERVLPYKMRIPMNRIFTRIFTCNSQKRVPTWPPNGPQHEPWIVQYACFAVLFEKCRQSRDKPYSQFSQLFNLR